MSRRVPAPRRTSLLTLLFAGLLGAILGCDEAETSALEPDAAPPAPDAAPAAPAHLVIALASPGTPTTGPLTVMIEPLEGDPSATTMIDLGTGPHESTLRIELPALPAGRYQVTAFYDRDADGVFNACPFPPTPDDPLRADRLDNVHAVFSGRIAPGVEVQVTLRRWLCGPGDPATGLSVELHPPGDAELEGRPLLALLEPLPGRSVMIADDEEPTAATLLRLPLRPSGLNGPTLIDVGQLVPGTYRMTFFTDDDRDLHPSVCTGGFGGGDRYSASIEAVEIISGEWTTLDPLTLEMDPECPETLTGLSGRLGLAADFEAEIADRPALSEQLKDSVWLALQPTQGGAPVVTIPLRPADDRRPLNLPFTVSGLPAGLWRATIWVDRDNDGQFIPCSGLPAGLDVVSWQSGQVRIREGQLLELGRVELTLEDCPAVEQPGIRGALLLPAGTGAINSGRPVRMELLSADAQGERRSLVLFENHRQSPMSPEEPGRVRFARALDVAPGRYQARLFLDTDRDGEFLSCLDHPFGDRATAEPFEVELTAGDLIDIGEQTIAPLDCAPPRADVEPAFFISEREVAALARAEMGVRLPLRVLIEELGGWRDDRTILEELPITPGFIPSPPISLAPGRFRLTFYIDRNYDAAWAPCNGDEGDLVMSTLEVELNRQAPIARPEVHLEARCPH